MATKRLALAATIAFFGINGHSLTLTNDEAYELVMAVAASELDDFSDIAAVLRHPPSQLTIAARPRSRQCPSSPEAALAPSLPLAAGSRSR